MSVYTASSGYSNITIGNPGAVTGAGASTNIISITNGGSGYTNSVLTATGTGATTWANNTSSKMNVKGQLSLDGEGADIIINGVSLIDLMNGITDRLSILQPSPEKLEKYEALRQAYEHYKTLESLLYDENNK
jgi:hypothetical protein